MREKKFTNVLLHIAKRMSSRVKVKLEVKTIGQELQNAVLYIFVPQLLLEIQQDLYKKKFFNFCVFVKKCGNHYAKTLKMQKLEKVILFILYHISSIF